MLNLISIRINGASTVIPDDAAAIANGAVIYGMADSTAKAYAEKFGRKFIEISHDHVYTETWTSNTESHWHACTICGDKKGTADHAYKDNCDTVCNICDYVREIVHDYADTWSHDNDNHWHECTVCGDKNNLVKHSYDNDCDTTCNICDYIRSTEHDYKTEWTLDGSSHWHACTICGDKKGVVAHTPGEAVISNKIEPTCTVEGSYDEVVSCRICGGLISNKTIMIDAPGHDFSDEYKYDISGHYRECGICSGKSATELHTFVDDTCICGYYEASSGVIGGITWSFDRESGVLVIGGEGAITGTDLPWGVFVDRIVKVELGGGITSINADIFEGCDNVIFVIININIVIGGSLGKTPTIIAPAGSPVYSYAKSSGINFIPSSGTGFCGSDGDNIYWSIENGKLTISGSGNMADFSGVSAPWADRIGQIKQIELGDGVTSIGGGAFAGCKNVIIIITNVNLIILGDGDTIGSGATVIIPEGSAASDYVGKYAGVTVSGDQCGICGDGLY